ncbi:hypothetical protein ACOME3_005804 [Neoechinorhynchus agilis]
MVARCSGISIDVNDVVRDHFNRERSCDDQIPIWIQLRCWKRHGDGFIRYETLKPSFFSVSISTVLCRFACVFAFAFNAFNDYWIFRSDYSFLSWSLWSLILSIIISSIARKSS